MGKDNFEGRKNEKMITQRLFKSFETLYLWMLYQESWKMANFANMKNNNAEDIACSWITLQEVINIINSIIEEMSEDVKGYEKM